MVRDVVTDSPAIGLLCVTTAVSTFTAVMPKMSDVRKSVNDPAMINDVRVAEATSAVIVIGVGIVATSVTKSPVPAMLALVSVATLATVYESVLATKPKEMTNATSRS